LLPLSTPAIHFHIGLILAHDAKLLEAHQTGHTHLHDVSVHFVYFCSFKIVIYKLYSIATSGPVNKGRHVKLIPKLPVLQERRTIPLVAFLIMSIHNSTLTAPFVGLAHSLARYLETFMILAARCAPEISVALVTEDPAVAWNTRGNGGEGFSRRVTSVLRASLATLVTCRTHIIWSWPPSVS